MTIVYPSTELLDAIGNNAPLDEIKKLIKDGADINGIGFNGVTPLLYAIQHSNLEVVRFLLKSGANIYASDWHSYRRSMGVFEYALAYANVEIMKEIIEIKDRQFQYYILNTLLNDYDYIFWSLTRNPDKRVLDFFKKAYNLILEDYKKYFITPNFIYFLYKNGVEIPKIVLKIADENGVTAFLLDCSNTDSIASINYFLDNGSDISYRDKEGADALIYAICNPNLEIAKYLIKIGAPIHTKDNNGRNLLHILCLNRDNYNNSIKKIKYVLSLGIDINEEDSSGRTPLELLVEKFSFDNIKGIFEFLAKNGAIIPKEILNGKDLFNGKDYVGVTYFLEYCEKTADRKLLDSFIKSGVDLNYRDKNGLDALQHSIFNPNIYVTKYFVKHGANIHTKDNKGRNILHTACLNNESVEKIKYILSLGININEKDYSEKTPLELVVEQELLTNNSYMNIIELLISEGAYIPDKTYYKIHLDKPIEKNDEPSKINKKTKAKEFLVNCRRSYYIDFIDSYLEKGGDLYCRDLLGFDALHYSMFNSNLDVTKHLIEKGASINTKDNKGRNILHTACAIGASKEKLDYILSLGFDINEKDNFGNTPLMLAAEKDSNTRVINYLVDKGANISERNNNGYDALLLSVLNTKNPQIFQLLLKLGADVNTKTQDELGLNALMVAILNNSSSWVIKTIIKSGIDIKEKDNNGNSALDYAKKQNNTELINALVLEGGS